MARAKTERVIVTVDDAHRPKIESVAAALRAAGMTVGEVMRTVGIITGEVPKGGKRALEGVPGVAAVEPDREVEAL